MEYDLHSNVKQEVALVAAAISSNTTTVGAIIDTRGYESLEFIAQSGVVTDGVFDFLLEQGEDPALADASAVPLSLTLGLLAGFISVDDNSAKRIGSIGKMRYQRLSFVSTGVTTGVDSMSAVAVLGHPKSAPTPE